MNDLQKDIVPDEHVVDISKPHLAAYWAEHFGVTETLLKEAVDTVGNSTELVADYINKIISYYMHIYAI